MTARARRPRLARRSPRPEGLEARHLCSIGDGGAVPVGTGSALVAPPDNPTPGVLSVVATDPAPGETLDASPSRLTLTFNEPIQAGSLSDGDVALEQVAADGTATPIPSTLTETLDATRTELIATLPDGPLAPGQYRIVLSGWSFLTGDDGAATSGVDQSLADFEVNPPAPKGPNLADATDLGALGPSPIVVGGALDLRSDPGGAQLYRVELPPGGPWRLGAEVTAQRDGGTLDAALALFDAEGHPLETDEFGLSDAPNDPFLFDGLSPGTYYLGVSGAGDLPGAPGGYDPAAGTPGSVPQSQDGGPFRLHVVADPIAGPTTLLASSADHADPNDPTPTGLTLQFSGPIRLDTPDGRHVGPLEDGLEVVDASGTAYPLMLSDVQQGGARLSFLFRTPPPPGHDEVRLAPSGGLVDLAGAPPVAPGQPTGLLTTFDVAPAATTAAADPLDLGPLTPDAVAAGVSGEVAIAPGASADFRFVVEFPGLYQIKDDSRGGAMSAVLLSADGVPIARLGSSIAGGETSPLRNLQPGVYSLRMAAIGSRDVHARLSIRWTRDQSSTDLILPNGVGQGPALALRLISPTVDPPAPTPPPAPTQTPTPTTTPTQSPATTPTTQSPPTQSPPTIDPMPAPAPTSSTPATASSTIAPTSASTPTPEPNPGSTQAPTPTPTPTIATPTVPTPTIATPTVPTPTPGPGSTPAPAPIPSTAPPSVASTPTVAPTPLVTATATVAATGHPAPSPGAAASAAGGAPPAGGAGLFLTLGGEAVGRPMPEADLVAAVASPGGPGPVASAVGGGAPAQSLSLLDLGDAFPGRTVPGAAPRGGNIPRGDIRRSDPGDGPPTDGAMIAATSPIDPTRAPSGPDEGMASDDSGWMDRVRRALAALLPRSTSEDPSVEGIEEAPRVEIARAPEDRGASDPGVERAALVPNLAIGLAAILAAQGVRVLRRRRASRGSARPEGRRAGSRGAGTDPGGPPVP